MIRQQDSEPEGTVPVDGDNLYASLLQCLPDCLVQFNGLLRRHCLAYCTSEGCACRIFGDERAKQGTNEEPSRGFNPGPEPPGRNLIHLASIS